MLLSNIFFFHLWLVWHKKLVSPQFKKTCLTTSAQINSKSPLKKCSGRLLLFIVGFLLLSGCTSMHTVNDIDENYSSNFKKRQASLAQINNWQVKGKIAFIKTNEHDKDRQSASLFWKKSKKNQQLNLTTYLGINVLNLTSINNIHRIEIGGKSYQSNNLSQLIQSLTNITFPAEALSYWIKAIPFNKQDNFTFDPVSNLPSTSTSYYNQRDWLIQYLSYQTLKQGNSIIALPNKIKVVSEDITIIIAINQWTL